MGKRINPARFTVGTHNLHDEAGEPSLFADLIVFTEAIPAKIAALVKGTPFRMLVCRQQPDLVVVYDSRIFRRQFGKLLRYVKYVDGWAHVTPNRGTFTVPLVVKAVRRRARVNAEHRINAAFDPFIRGEAVFRAAKWREHTDGTLDIMRRQDEAGLLVISAGDDNTPHGVRAYPGYCEAGAHFDRIGSNAVLRSVKVGPKRGSDHNELSAVVVAA